MPTSERLTLADGTRLQCYLAGGSLAGNPNVTRALVVVHGVSRNPVDYLGYALNAAKLAGLDKQTIVVAPWFKTKDDKPAKGDAVWSSDGWKDGTDKASSFAAMDQLLAVLTDLAKFPRLARCVLSGHSAGAQFTQRYAALGKAPAQCSFVVANPSSFVYLDGWRPVPVPSKCAKSYNSYKYGLGKRTGYVAALTAEQARAQYLGRRVTILNGSADTTDNGDLDETCPAMAQGKNRLLRGQYFHAHHPSVTHDRVIVPGVAHDARAMFASPLAWPSLFGAPSI